MSRFILESTPLAGLMAVQRQPLQDSRGFLSRMFCAADLAPAGWTWPIVQINHTQTVQRGTVRGMHFQHSSAAEAKLVSCLRGAVWDVAVDLRAGSPTFLQWFGRELSASNHWAMLIPPGFAHGFQALSDDCEMLYLHSSPYAPASEGGLDALDPRLGIAWPLSLAGRSPRDAQHPLLAPAFTGLVLY